MKKNVLAWIVTSYNVHTFVSPHKFMLGKVVENFDEFYVLNLINFKIFKNLEEYTNGTSDNNNIVNDQSLLDKIKIFEPTNEEELKNFLKDKRLVGINNIGKSIFDFRVHFTLKKYKIKMVHFANIGNQQITYKPLKGNRLRGFLYNLEKKLSKNLISLLGIFKIVPKNEITFISNTKLLKTINQSKIKKFLYTQGLLYTKKFVLVNSRAHDFYLEQANSTMDEKQITYIDSNINHEFQQKYGYKPNKFKIEQHYKHTIIFLKKISLMFNKSVVICIHPRDNLEKKKKIYKQFKVVQNLTRENILLSYLVLFYDTSAIIDAIIMKKRLITLVSNYQDNNMLKGSDIYKNILGIPQMNIENKDVLDINILENELNLSLRNYDVYKENNISPDGNNIGYKKIFKTIKDELFND